MNEIRVGDYVRGIGDYSWIIKAKVLSSTTEYYKTVEIVECINPDDDGRQVGKCWTLMDVFLRLFNDFTTDDLMFGDIVTYRCGQKAICNGIRLIDESYQDVEDVYCDFDVFEKNLLCNQDHNYDIIKVERNGYVIYECKLEREERELTVEEISNLLGYDVKIVRG